MGQFLAIGIATKIGVKKAELSKAQIVIEELKEIMQQELHYTPEIYTVSENENFHHFTLKDEILHAELIPFLETIYPLLYKNPAYYESILKKLKILSQPELLQWTEKKLGESFQFDEYGESDYLETKYSNIRIYYECILISMEGKIMMEVFGRQFNFFKYTMMQTFKQFTIAGALRVYITG